MVSLEAVTRTDWVRGSGTALTVTCFFMRSLMPALRRRRRRRHLCRRKRRRTGGAPAPVCLALAGLVGIREKGEQFGGHIGAIGVGEEEKPDLNGVFLRNIQLDNDVGDAGHEVRRRADQDGVVLVVRNGVDVNAGPPAFIGGRPPPPPPPPPPRPPRPHDEGWRTGCRRRLEWRWCLP